MNLTNTAPLPSGGVSSFPISAHAHIVRTFIQCLSNFELEVRKILTWPNPILGRFPTSLAKTERGAEGRQPCVAAKRRRRMNPRPRAGCGSDASRACSDDDRKLLILLHCLSSSHALGTAANSCLRRALARRASQKSEASF